MRIPDLPDLFRNSCSGDFPLQLRRAWWSPEAGAAAAAATPRPVGTRRGGGRRGRIPRVEGAPGRRRQDGEQHLRGRDGGGRREAATSLWLAGRARRWEGRVGGARGEAMAAMRRGGGGLSRWFGETTVLNSRPSSLHHFFAYHLN